jgi:very-short-patch-repair endonuclease
LTKHDRLITFAKENRKRPTGGERDLWRYLRNRKCHGVKFYRQRPIGPYIADFASVEVMLVVELDGAGHALQQPYDLARKAALEALGYRVIRIGSERQFSEWDQVVTFIFDEVERRLTERPQPKLPPEEEEVERGQTENGQLPATGNQNPSPRGRGQGEGWA